MSFVEINVHVLVIYHWHNVLKINGIIYPYVIKSIDVFRGWSGSIFFDSAVLTAWRGTLRQDDVRFNGSIDRIQHFSDKNSRQQIGRISIAHAFFTIFTISLKLRLTMELPMNIQKAYNFSLRSEKRTSTPASFTCHDYKPTCSTPFHVWVIYIVIADS